MGGPPKEAVNSRRFPNLRRHEREERARQEGKEAHEGLCPSRDIGDRLRLKRMHGRDGRRGKGDGSRRHPPWTDRRRQPGLRERGERSPHNSKKGEARKEMDQEVESVVPPDPGPAQLVVYCQRQVHHWTAGDRRSVLRRA